MTTAQALAFVTTLIPPADLAALIRLESSGTISHHAARQALASLYSTRRDQIVKFMQNGRGD